MKIEEAAAKRQAQIDSRAESIIGVNKYRLEKEDPIDILDIDNTLVRQKQIDRINQMKADVTKQKLYNMLATIDGSGTKWRRQSSGMCSRCSTCTCDNR